MENNKVTLQKIQSFPIDVLSSSQRLFQILRQTLVEQELKRNKCRRIGHPPRKDRKTRTSRTLTWNPLGKRSRGHLQLYMEKGTGRRDEEDGSNYSGQWRGWPRAEASGNCIFPSILKRQRKKKDDYANSMHEPCYKWNVLTEKNCNQWNSIST